MIEVNGFSPFDNAKVKNFEKNDIFVLPALKKAISIQKKTWSEKTLASSSYHYNAFIKFIEDNNLQSLLISQINKRHITSFLNGIIKKGSSPKTRNNYRATISSLFKQLVDDDFLDRNICLDISKLKTEPKKNIPFTKVELKKIKEYLLKKDPYLYQYILFIGYAFLRPIEVNRIKIKDFDFEQNIVRVKTKTGYQSISKSAYLYTFK